MAEEFQYQKERKKFGRYPLFEDTETRIVCLVNPQPEMADQYVLRDPNKIVLDNIPQMSEHRVSYNFQTLLSRAFSNGCRPNTGQYRKSEDK